jgi:hypothetical protein
MHDVFDGHLLREFKGPDGKHLFSDRPDGNEARYVFSLCVDFFNPFGNKQAGKKNSIGIMSLVCLNLPPESRYKPENMFLSVVPGPHEPPLNELNHYLTPLVDDLLDFWNPGVWFSRTHNYPDGRLVRAALIALVSDLPAARKTAGFASHRHTYFCAICHCRRDVEGYGATDYASWTRRTNEECRRHANKHKNATSESDRQSAFDEAGIRWSELLRLPYFDPTQFVVVDSMHSLFLGLIREHCQSILGIRVDNKDDDDVALVIKFSTAPENATTAVKKSIRSIERLLSSRYPDGFDVLQKKLARLHLAALKSACDELKLVIPSRIPGFPAKPSRANYAVVLADWVGLHDYPTDSFTNFNIISGAGKRSDHHHFTRELAKWLHLTNSTKFGKTLRKSQRRLG